MTKAILLGATLGLALVGCSADPMVNSATDGGDTDQAKVSEHVITLGVGESAVIGPNDASVTFVGVPHDSRCPSDVVCIWEGQGVVRLRLDAPGEESEFVEASVFGDCPGAGAGCAPPVDSLGYRFQVLDLDPYPLSDVTIEDSSYVVTLAAFPHALLDSVEGDVLVDLPFQPNEVSGPGPARARIEDDILHFEVAYSGGCKDHVFRLYMSPAAFFESQPVQVELYLREAAVDDPCEAYIIQPLAFDLRPLAYLQEIIYGEPDCILINLYPGNDPSGEPTKLLYRPEGTPASKWCVDDRL
jgi:hypothetical protein